MVELEISGESVAEDAVATAAGAKAFPPCERRVVRAAARAHARTRIHEHTQALSTTATADAVDAAGTAKEGRHTLSPMALAIARSSQWRAGGGVAKQPSSLHRRPPQPPRRDDTGEAAGDAGGEAAGEPVG